jgi:DNA-binding NtrC family response regulator
MMNKNPSNPTGRRPDGLKILFADDEPHLQQLMSLELPRMGHEVTVCPDGAKAVTALQESVFDCLLVDLNMPGLGGIEVIAKARELAPGTDAVVLTGKSSFETAVEALRLGASDYLTKPCKLVELNLLLQRIAEKRSLTNRCRALQSRLERVEGRSQLIGQSHEMRQVRLLIEKVAPTESTVLICGETGTGKELAARAVHDQSRRADRPYVAVNCGALPENLIESELFGHRKGAFTGADEQRVGLFEVAHGGTIFLDEIGELPLGLQAKLLRVLESGEVRRVGDNQSFQVNTRIVCATNRSLDEMVRDGTFREDLMYRINTFEILLPPLRDRLDDIPILAEHLLRRFVPKTAPAGGPLLSPEAVEHLQKHHWPGNVRELANVLEHASILCESLPITIEDLPRRFRARENAAPPAGELGVITLHDLELRAIRESLERHGGDKPAAARELGISLKTLYNKLNQMEEPGAKAA